MDVRAALKSAFLSPADAEILLAGSLGKNRAWLLAHPEYELSAAEWTQFGQWVERRRQHEPVAYITGQQEFYGRMFKVDARVLIPRPATEGVVRAALTFLDDPKDASEEVDSGIAVTTRVFGRNTDYGLRKAETIVDVGTGSGAIAITLALERPDMRIIATDISADALEVARANAVTHHVEDRVEFRQGDGMKPVMDLDEPFLLVSNPPYVLSGRSLMKDVQDYEPHVAIFGGPEGTDLITSIVRDAKAHPACVGMIMECETAQAAELSW